MRKTNFQNTIHPATTLFTVGSLSMLISILLRLGMNPLENSTYFTSLFDFLSLLHFISSSISFLSLLLFFGLLGYEIKIRQNIREESASLIIPVPKSQQAIRILKDLETIISEEISSRNPDYYFSRPERMGMYFYFIGTRRK